MPVELERANMFPDDHTCSANDSKRAFFMGNALVVGVIEKLGNGIVELIESKN
jgi:DNA (cytosine-5)-methyltransferase 1